MSRVVELVALLWAHQHIIRVAIHRAGVARSDREDAAQEALTTAWRAIIAGRIDIAPDVDPEVPLRRWLYGLSRNVGLAYRVKNKPIGYPLEHDVPSADPIGQIEAREEVRIAFYRLNRAEREALTGIAIGEKFIEIAKRTKTPIGSVAGRVGRVRAELRKRRAKER